MKTFLFRISLSLLLVFSVTLLAHAQNRTVTGTVMDASTGEPIPGATVYLEGTNTGTITDLNGEYSIEVSGDNPVLVFSFVGYENVTMAVNGQSTIDVNLELDLRSLDEVVVVGYGTQKKEDLTGSVSVVDVDEMVKSSFSSIDKAFQGRAAGVHVTATTGQPGKAATVLVRGVGSISLNAEPLYVVDGMPVSSEVLVSINPADIESFQVLKDASATAIYGARGANGVIIITTRKGESGKPKFNFNATGALSRIPETYDVMNTGQYEELMRASYENYLEKYPDKNNNWYSYYSDSARASNNNLDTDTDWQDAMSRIGQSYNVNASVSGGSENSSYFISGNYNNEEGIMINTNFERLTLRANSDFKLSDRIKIGESIGISRINLNDQSHIANFNSWYVTTIASPLMPVYDETGLGGYGGPVDTLTGANERTNPVAEQMLNEHYYNETGILASAYIDLELLRNLVYTFKIGANLKNRVTTQWSPEYTLGNMRLRDNDISKLKNINSYNRDLVTNNQLTYSNSVGDHNFTLMAAYERTNLNTHSNAATGWYITNPDLPVLQQAEEAAAVEGEINDHRLESLLARLNYDYKGKYLLTASIRRDGSSRFGPIGGRYGNFPSFSVGWKINEDFLEDVDQINMLKLRAGWGQTGNENLEDYQYLALMDPLRNSRYSFGTGTPQTLFFGGASTSFQPNPLIKWEAASMTNIGVDLNAFNNRLQLTVEYYIKNQEDMIVKRPISVTFGKYVAYGPTETIGAWANIGKVQNRGFEFAATWKKLEGDFRYEISANFSTYKNEVIDLGLNRDLGAPEIITRYTQTVAGHTIGSFYGYVAERILQEEDFLQDEEGNLVTDADGNYTILHALQEQGTSPGDIKFADLNQDGIINDLDRTIIGKPLPDFGYGLNIDLYYKNFDFTVFFQGMQNMEVYNNVKATIGIATDKDGKDQNKLVETLDYWTAENRSNTMTRAFVVDENLNSRISTWFLEDASFMRIKTLQLGYNLPPKALGNTFQGLRIYLNANNLYTLTDYSGYDPEIGSDDPLNQGIDLGYYPVPRTYMVGLQLNF